MIIDSSTPLSSALSYLLQGLSVFPLAAKEKKPPSRFKWEQFQHTLPSQEHVKSWFEGKDSNIAIATGSVSRLIAFDFDGSIAKSDADEIIQNGIRQDTREAKASNTAAATRAANN
jgi:hypothetical protein